MVALVAKALLAIPAGAIAVCKGFAQRLVIAMGFFGGNGLANHAAAVAYGFLLSAAPMLLLASFLLVRALHADPGIASAALRGVPFVGLAFDWDSPALERLIHAPPGLPALASLLGVLWAGRVFALSMQRGLNVVFFGAKKRNPVKENALTLGLELVALVVVLAAILARAAWADPYGFVAAAAGRASAPGGSGALFLAAFLGPFLLLAYRLIPANRPRWSAAGSGAALCMAAYGAAAALTGALGRRGEDALYGALGEVLVALVGVYFFFLFFFLGAQFAAVSNSFEALLFLRLRSTVTGKGPRKGLGPRIERALFGSAGGRLARRRRLFRAGDVVLIKGDEGREVFFLLEGEVEALLPSRGGQGKSAGVIKAGSFVGEIGFLLSEGRSATVVARTDVVALELPPELFGEVLGNDAGLDKAIIENLSRRIKRGNERISDLSGRGAEDG